MNIFHKIILALLACAGALGIQAMDAHAKSVSIPVGVHGMNPGSDPIGDIIGARMGWDKSVPAKVAPKPAVKSAAGPASTDVGRDAAAAEKAARDFTFALAFSR